MSEDQDYEDSEGLNDVRALKPAFKNRGDRRAPRHVVLIPQTESLNEPNKLTITESIAMDYFTLTGIENKLGLKSEDIPTYISQELLTNALDYVETLTNTIPEVTVEITSDDVKVIHLKVSNPDIGRIFTAQTIHDIFDFDNYSSSKRRQFKVTRGALGHGLKTVLGTSYTLANEYYQYSDWAPLKIKNGNKLWTVAPVVDRIKGKVYAPLVTSESIINILRTEIEVDIPVNSVSKNRTLEELMTVFYKFLILNPHIEMILTKDGQQYTYPQVQKIKSGWKNLHSIHSYSYKDFENLIFNIKEENMTLYEVVRSLELREGWFLDNEGLNISLTEAKYDPIIIHKLYDKLRDLRDPKEKLDLPYDMRIKARKAALIKRCEQSEIQVKNIKYELVSELHESKDNQIRFPYIFEVAEIETQDVKHLVISGINSSPIELEYMHSPKNFNYLKKSCFYESHFISDILQRECGYSNDPKKCKKPNTIVFMNLISPRIDYESYAKSQVNLGPFSEVIGQTVYDICKGVKRGPKGKITQTDLLTDLLTARNKAVQQDHDLIVSDRWTPSDLWYGCRVDFDKNGIKVGPNTRKNFSTKIRPLIEKLFNCNMEELGIFAADRAQMYFDGRWYDVGFDELDSLSVKGTDLMIFEKEGMAETLTSLADNLGFAILFTRGFATKYVSDLSELSKKDGCNVLVLSDYDASGLLLASKLNVPRIGIDPQTLEYFHLERRYVEEEYNPANHLVGIYHLVSKEEYSYLSHKRIEINSVKTKVGTKAFQEWITHKIIEKFPFRNYNRAIKIGDPVLPDGLADIFANIKSKIQNYQKKGYSEIINEQSKIEGFIDNVAERRIEYDIKLKNIITHDPNYEDFVNKLNELVQSHLFIAHEVDTKA